MKLCYLDESGHTGNNLNDPQQPHYVLGGLIVLSTQWSDVASELGDVILAAGTEISKLIRSKISADGKLCRYWTKKVYGSSGDWKKMSMGEQRLLLNKIETYLENKFEVHACPLFQGNEDFIGVDIPTRLKIASDMLDVAEKHELIFLYTHIDKFKHAARYTNPHPPDEWAFTLMAEVFDDYLDKTSGEKYGMFIADVSTNGERLKSHLAQFQKNGTPYYYGKSKIGRVVDSIHFVQSYDSKCVQLSDLCTYLITQNINGRTKWNKFIDRVEALVGGKKSFP